MTKISILKRKKSAIFLNQRLIFFYIIRLNLSYKRSIGMAHIFPSLISADLLQLAKVIDHLEPHCAGFHLDVMDFHFVPNLTWGPPFINAIAQHITKRLQIHLMVDKPAQYFDRMALRPGDVVTVHYEALGYQELIITLNTIKQYGWVPSLAINPSTPLHELVSLLPYCSHIVLMSVNPGFSGQPFIKESFDRLKDLIALRAKYNASFAICLDGGINNTNFCALQKLGMDEAAIASAIFSTPDSINALQTIQHCNR